MGSRRLAIGLVTMSTLLAGLILEATRSRAGVGLETGFGPTVGQTSAGTITPPLLDLPPNDMGHNGLSNKSLFDNALTMNPRALNVLLNHPLDSNIFNSQDYVDMKYQLLDKPAQDVMEELVRCALSPTSPSVKYTDPTDSKGHSIEFPGELGLCTKGQDDWSSQRPSEKCLQLVTACLLARTNALHRRVPISLRSPEREPGSVLSEAILPTRVRVLIENEYRESSPTEGVSNGTPIPSFDGYLPPQRSVAGVAGVGSGHFPTLTTMSSSPTCILGPDCGWQQAYVGTCQHGTEIELRAQADCKISIRACGGIYGCENSPGASSLKHPYSVILGQSSSCSLTFRCPLQPSEPGEVVTHGTYGVMIKSSGGNLTKLTVHTGKYPSPEVDIFQFREGAFFGNLFEPNELTRTREMTMEGGKWTALEAIPISSISPMASASSNCQSAQTIIPYQHVYACYSLEQSPLPTDIQSTKEDGSANLNDRICAEPNSTKCFPHAIVACVDRCSQSADKRVYESCKGDPKTDNKTYSPITTYLDEPCSLLDSQQCDTLHDHRNFRFRTGPPIP
jgi:hypothetical protein